MLNWLDQFEMSHPLHLPSHSLFSYTGRNWMPLAYGTSGLWNLETTIDLRPRSDTSAPNNSPMTSSLPVYLYVKLCSWLRDCFKYKMNEDIGPTVYPSLYTT